jgi:hypothetical protein
MLHTYDHNFPGFSTIVGEKLGVFPKNQCYDQVVTQTSSSLSKKTPIFWPIFLSCQIFQSHNDIAEKNI